MKKMLAALALVGLGGAAQAWPDKPITLIVPYPAGGLSDAVTRIVANEVASSLGQSVVVVNRGGAAGKIGLEELKRSPKDGHTIGLALLGPMVTLPLTDPNFGIEPLKDFEPISIAVNTFGVLVSNPSVLPAANLRELTAYAKQHPGKLNYGTPGAGTSFHFHSVFLAHKLGIEAVHVPYKGEGPAVNDLAAGVLHYMLAGTSARPFIESKKIRPIAVASEQRVGAYPDVPTFRELGVDLKWDGWVGYIAPAGVPADILDRLNDAFVKAVRSPKVRQAIVDSGYVPVGSTRAEFRREIEDTTRRYAQTLRSGMVKLKD